MNGTSEIRLFPFQIEGVKTLLSQPAVLLADDMGLGKTLQTITALHRLLKNQQVRSALIVLPANLMRQWRCDFHRWVPDLEVLCLDGNQRVRDWKWGLSKQVYLVSYETLRNDLGHALRQPWDLVILDEAQRIKNRDTAVSRACKKLTRARAWALTGTPLENREEELGSVLEFVQPHVSGTRTLPLMPGPRLRNLQSQLQLRRRKQDVLKDLPPKTCIRLEVEMTPAQRQAYKQVESGLNDKLRSLGPNLSLMNVLQVISKLKQTCNFCPKTGESAKLNDLRQRLDNISRSGHRALLFSQWKNDNYGIGRLQKELQPYLPLTYSGDLDLQQRQARVYRFQTNPEHKILLISLKAGGTGLNLQAASYVIHFDRWWNPAAENQATDRAHRMGQVNPVTVYSYTTIDSIEERIERILDAKLALFADIVDRVSLDPGKLLSPAELYRILGLPAPISARQTRLEQTEQFLLAAQEILRQNRWTLRSRTCTVQVFERLDELGWPESLQVMQALPDTKDAALQKFGDENPSSKKLVLVVSRERSRVQSLVGPGVLCWDPESLSNLLPWGGA